MKRTISFMTGKGSVNHNSRKFHAKNIDSERSYLNVEYCNEDVKDVLHDSFLKIFDAIGSFEYRGKGSLKGWLTRITVNQALKFLHDNSRMEFVEISDREQDISDEEPCADSIPPSVIYNLIREMPDGYRTIFNLYVIEGKSHKEISALLNIKESTSASQLHRAKSTLAAKIRQYQTLTPIPT